MSVTKAYFRDIPATGSSRGGCAGDVHTLYPCDNEVPNVPGHQLRMDGVFPQVTRLIAASQHSSPVQIYHYTPLSPRAR